ncbi:MAG: IS21 family transposase [Bacilli bacterium]|nr:IS21 family transposase [Bacilli bacterium]
MPCMTLIYRRFFMIQYRKILELHFKEVSQRTISSSVGNSRQSVSDVIQKFKEKRLVELTDEMDDQWLEEFLFPEKLATSKGYFPVDWEEIHRELQKKNITLKLLHNEYSSIARDSKKIPYAYRTFCRHYGNYAKKHKVTMPIRRKPGEIMEVDWAGSTLSIKDPASGERLNVYVFVASLPYSQIFYAEGFLDMTSQSWLRAHINAFEYFGGASEVLVPDNLKTGVTKAKGVESILNQAYRELADYYRTTILPARIKKPKDKPSVEGNVGYVSRQIIASLRNYQSFSLNKLNEKILEEVDRLNDEEFQKREGSRRSIFEEEEKARLIPLPYPKYQLSEWRTAKVQLNYHIQVNRMYYSVPYEYIQSQVELRISHDLIEVYFKNMRIASHKLLRGEIGQYSTNPNHMPDKHRKYLEHTPDQVRQWASLRGAYIENFADYILNNNVEKKALSILLSLKNLTKHYSDDLLNKGCQTLMEISEVPSLTVLKSILKRMVEKEKAKKANTKVMDSSDSDYGFVRGAKYFGGVKNEK